LRETPDSIEERVLLTLEERGNRLSSESGPAIEKVGSGRNGLLMVRISSRIQEDIR
jgi:hypothetical protein